MTISDAPSTCCAGKGCANCGHTGMLEEQPLAELQYFNDADNAHDGPGWYYWDDEYRDEGSVGAFATREEAILHATDAGYRLAGPDS